MNDFWQDIHDMPREDLVDLLVEYDKYLERARDEDRFHQGWVPVCIAEFYESEFRMIRETEE